MGDMGGRSAPPERTSRDRLTDVMLAVVVLALTVPATLTGHPFPPLPAPVWVQTLSGVAAAAAMLVRRRTIWPMVVTAATCSLFSGHLVPLTLAAFAMTALSEVPRWRWIAGAMAAVYVVADYSYPRVDRLLYLAVVHALTMVYLPALVGTWVGEYRRMVGELRAGLRVREERAASQERRRIAAELHDTVTHAVTVMVLNAGLIQDSGDLGEIRKLARDIEDKGVRALTELRELLSVLRRSDVPPSAEGVDGIPRLVEEGRATGLSVSLHLDVPKGVLTRQAGHACFRVVQEGLNNVRKHAPGAAVQVVCEARGEMVNVSVVNGRDGRAVRTRVPRAAGAGYGLAGLRERVMLAGGCMTSGPTAEGGFSLNARIPCHPPGSGH
ncbi:sensor histidine kinase [Microbispora sp. NPDC049125]|uniref:sensor histidine kinase n=1 Tax=Microbispora sp. NPDC049125 TaxID=3154929 RepID=UPI003466A8C0